MLFSNEPGLGGLPVSMWFYYFQESRSTMLFSTRVRVRRPTQVLGHLVMANRSLRWKGICDLKKTRPQRAQGPHLGYQVNGTRLRHHSNHT